MLMVPEKGKVNWVLSLLLLFNLNSLLFYFYQQYTKRAHNKNTIIYLFFCNTS